MSTRKFWADGRDVLQGDHEADTGLIATAVSAESATLIALALTLAFDVLKSREELENIVSPKGNTRDD